MEKKEMIDSIAKQYEAIGIVPEIGGSSDIAVDQELLDVKHPTGKIKIHYENAVLFNEKEKTINFWELTKEIKSGFSFGFTKDSFSQNGSTLSRKVKAVQYSTDGKAYEYDFDIGKLNQIIKSAAKKNGWKFKVILSKKKASY